MTEENTPPPIPNKKKKNKIVIILLLAIIAIVIYCATCSTNCETEENAQYLPKYEQGEACCKH